MYMCTDGENPENYIKILIVIGTFYFLFYTHAYHPCFLFSVKASTSITNKDQKLI